MLPARGRRRSEAAAAVRARLAAVAARGWVPGADLGLEGVREVGQEEYEPAGQNPPKAARGDGRESMATAAARLWRDLPDDAAPDSAGEFSGWDRPGGRHAHAGGGLLRDLVARCREFRLDPGRRPAVAVVVVAVVALLITVALVWRSRPTPEAVGAPPVTAAATAPVISSPPAPSTAAGLVVAVTGKVRRPGLVHLPPGARVADAITAAGGLRPGADIGLLNLARVLTDGEQVLVGIGGSGAATVPADGGGSAAAGPVHLNTATAEQLDTLPGVGEVTAQKIIDYRTAHGPFRSIDALQDVPGIGPSRFAEIAPQVAL